MAKTNPHSRISRHHRRRGGSLDRVATAQPSKKQRPGAEWLTLAVAALIVSTIVGLVIYSWFTLDRQPPILEVVRSGEIRQSQNQFYVPFTVTNRGGDTAEAVQIVGELRRNGEVLEAGDQQIDYLSEQETAEGAFVFSQDPNSGNLSIRVASYKLP